MSAFLDQLQKYIERHALFKSNDQLLLAVSGGLDSVVMAQGLQLLGYKFCIAHCNFNLRGEESKADEKFVRQLALSFQVPFFLKQFETSQLAQESKVSIQMVARDLRYAWLEEIRFQHGYAFVAAAHHQNDLVETVLLNLVRGTGLAGFHGILPKQGNVVRPLLFATREQVEDFAKDYILRWREDTSNASNKYARNLVRNKVIPILKTLNPSLENTMKSTAEKVALAEKVLARQVEEAKSKWVTEGQGFVKIDIQGLQSIPNALYFLHAILQEFGFSWSVSKKVMESGSGISGKIFYSSTHRLLKDRENWIIDYREVAKFVPVSILPTTQTVRLLFGKVLNLKLLEGGLELVTILKSKSSVLLDYDKLVFPLTLRSWQEGDTFIPFGMEGEKKISDFLIDAKYSLFEKERIVVLQSGQEIVAIIGCRSGQRYSVGQATKRILVAELVFIG